MAITSMNTWDWWANLSYRTESVLLQARFRNPPGSEQMLAGQLLRSLSDDELTHVLQGAQSGERVKTLDERFLDPTSDQRISGSDLEQKYQREQQNNPKKIRRLNEIAVILNTSTDAQQFRDALNEGMVLMGREPFFPGEN
jgi:hypothetical protein